MSSETAGLTDRQLLDKVARNIDSTEKMAVQLGAEPSFRMDLTTAKRLVALARSGLPSDGSTSGATP